MTFEQFMNEVDGELERISSLSNSDLADYCYRDAYDDGESPAHVAVDALINNDFPEDLF